MHNQPLMLFHLKLVAKISLAVGALAVLALLMSLTFVSGQPGASYFDTIRSSSITRAQLGPVMLITGLVLVAIAGVVTWLIALYSSFRIAGPLYRFSQNLKLAAASDAAMLVDLRKGDALLQHACSIKQAVAAVRAHYAGVEQLSEQASRALESGDAAAYADAVSRLKALDEKVRA